MLINIYYKSTGNNHDFNSFENMENELDTSLLVKIFSAHQMQYEFLSLTHESLQHCLFHSELQTSHNEYIMTYTSKGRSRNRIFKLDHRIAKNQ